LMLASPVKPASDEVEQSRQTNPLIKRAECLYAKHSASMKEDARPMSTSDTANTKKPGQKTERHEFQAEVSRLLHMMVHSVYSEKEVFLRELISNASDACDRLRHMALTQSGLLGEDSEFKISVSL